MLTQPVAQPVRPMAKTASNEVRQNHQNTPLKSVNEQINTDQVNPEKINTANRHNDQITKVTDAVNNFQKSTLTSLKNLFTYLTDKANLSFLSPTKEGLNNRLGST